MISTPDALAAQTWLQRLDNSVWALPLLFLLSMLETLLIPIPIETILIPWMLGQKQRRWLIATVALAGNVTAAAIGFWLGVLAMDQFGESLIQLFGGPEVYDSFTRQIQQDGFSAILAIGISPAPFQSAMLAAGAAGYSFLLFLLAVALSRAVRYYGLVLLVNIAGDAALKLWRRYSRQLGAVLLVLAVAWLWFVFS